MTGSRKITNRSNNWNPEWYESMRAAAVFVRSGQFNQSLFDLDELINEAWLNAIRRLRPDAPCSQVFSICVRSMRQYTMGGCPRKRLRRMHDSDIAWHSLFDDEGRLWCDHPAPNPHVVIDTVDDIVFLLRGYPRRTRSMILARLAGKTMRQIGTEFRIAESRVSQILAGVFPLTKD